MFEAQIDRTPFQLIRVLALFVLKMTLNWDSRAPLAMTQSPAWVGWLSRGFFGWLLSCSLVLIFFISFTTKTTYLPVPFPFVHIIPVVEAQTERTLC